MECEGSDSEEICGGRYRMSVYKVKSCHRRDKDDGRKDVEDNNRNHIQDNDPEFDKDEGGEDDEDDEDHDRESKGYEIEGCYRDSIETRIMSTNYTRSFMSAEVGCTPPSDIVKPTVPLGWDAVVRDYCCSCLRHLLPDDCCPFASRAFTSPGQICHNICKTGDYTHFGTQNGTEVRQRSKGIKSASAFALLSENAFVFATPSRWVDLGNGMGFIQTSIY